MNTSQTKSNAISKPEAAASAEISKVGISAIGITAGIIGCWAIACLFSATISSGPAGLISNLIQAITG